MKKATLWCFLAYFIILFAERTQSLIRIFIQGSEAWDTGFEIYVNSLAILSLAATLVLLIGFNREFWKSLVDSRAQVDVTMLSVTAGVILLSGMVHTEYTIPGIQFASYGILILGMILQTILSVKAGGSAGPLWYSQIYLIAFSMAIPVMYHSNIVHATLFHILEAITAFVLVCMFTYMMLRIMKGEGENLLLWIPFLTMLVLDTILIVMWMPESLNVFVLIFASASTLLFLVGKILTATVWKRSE